MFCKAKSAQKKTFFCVAILDHFQTKNFKSETTSFHYFSPRIPTLLKYWTSNGTSKVNTHTHTNTHMDISTYRKHWPRGPMLWKSHIRETKHLSTNADSSTDTKKILLVRQNLPKTNFFLPGDFRPLSNKNVQMWDHFFPLLFPKDSESLKILEIRFREVGAKRPLNGTSKVNRQTNKQTDKHIYRHIDL